MACGVPVYLSTLYTALLAILLSTHLPTHTLLTLSSVLLAFLPALQMLHWPRGNTLVSRFVLLLVVLPALHRVALCCFSLLLRNLMGALPHCHFYCSILPFPGFISSSCGLRRPCPLPLCTPRHHPHGCRHPTLLAAHSLSSGAALAGELWVDRLGGSRY